MTIISELNEYLPKDLSNIVCDYAYYKQLQHIKGKKEVIREIRDYKNYVSNPSLIRHVEMNSYYIGQKINFPNIKGRKIIGNFYLSHYALYRLGCLLGGVFRNTEKIGSYEYVINNSTKYYYLYKPIIKFNDKVIKIIYVKNIMQ